MSLGVFFQNAMSIRATEPEAERRKFVNIMFD
jgi:hypothetical protein